MPITIGKAFSGGSFGLTSTGMITDNLVMHLQSGNPRSYIGSGSTWNDMTSGDNNTSLVNTPIYNSTDSGGSVEFNGTNQYGTFPLTGLPTGNSSRTLSVWMKTTTTATGVARLAFAYGNAVTSQGVALGIYNGQYAFSGYGDDIFIGTVTTDTWLNLVGVYNGITAFVYLNGSLLTSTAKTWNTGTNGGSIGRYPDGSFYFQGSVAEVTVYNIALNSTQVLRNFNATRTRFGV